MRLASLVMLLGCSSSGSSPTVDPPPARALDPLGPCQRFEGDRCLTHDPLFADAAAAPVVKLPVKSSPTRRYVARLGPRGTVELGVEPSARGAVRIYRWAPGHEGWISGEDSFTAVEPGATWSLTFASEADQRIAVVADADFIVTLTAR